jgi:hypothetical protein
MSLRWKAAKSSESENSDVSVKKAMFKSYDKTIFSVFRVGKKNPHLHCHLSLNHVFDDLLILLWE